LLIVVEENSFGLELWFEVEMCIFIQFQSHWRHDKNFSIESSKPTFLLEDYVLHPRDPFYPVHSKQKKSEAAWSIFTTL
jgi:hypothetical protein